MISNIVFQVLEGPNWEQLWKEERNITNIEFARNFESCFSCISIPYRTMSYIILSHWWCLSAHTQSSLIMGFIVQEGLCIVIEFMLFGT